MKEDSMGSYEPNSSENIRNDEIGVEQTGCRRDKLTWVDLVDGVSKRYAVPIARIIVLVSVLRD